MLLKESRSSDELLDLIKTSIVHFLSKIGKARASNIVRTLMDCFLDIRSGTNLEIDVCKDNIDWAECKQRSFLCQTLQVRLIALNHEKAMFDDALDLTSKFSRVLKKIDDKHLIVDVQLLESQIFYSLEI
ncbi:hypothetical protein GJ496_000339 [Pomphorhynchus laevis]|nr:hypothetical protein GJ496_000339 [Pomphorhynchus laevis]